MKNSNIEWTDHTANFWQGCTKVSPGCAYCYAEARDKRHMIEAVDHWGPGAPRLKSKGAIKNCLQWNKAAEGLVERPRVFSLSLGDWLDPEVPVEWRTEMLHTIWKCQNLDFLLCTKRPEFWFELITRSMRGDQSSEACDSIGARMRFVNWLHGWTLGKFPNNVWLLVSTENQEALEKRVPDLLSIPAMVHGLSCEPLLGALDLGLRFNHLAPALKINWVIVGGESGPRARNCELDWIASIVRQCREADVACFVKQLGDNPMGIRGLYGKKGSANLNDWPEEMRVRQFPSRG